MEYEKIANLKKTPDQPSRFRTKNWVEINDESRGGYTTAMLRSGLCDYADAYIIFKETIAITGAGDDVAARWANERNKGVIFKHCAPFTKCISKINDTEIDNG